MPYYEVEIYELHAAKYRVKADSAAEAVEAVVKDGGLRGEYVDDSDCLIETADRYGTELSQLRDKLPSRDFARVYGLATTEDGRSFVPGLRDVEESDDQGE